MLLVIFVSPPIVVTWGFSIGDTPPVTDVAAITPASATLFIAVETSILFRGVVAAIAPASATLFIAVETSILLGGDVIAIDSVFSNLLGGGVAASTPASAILLIIVGISMLIGGGVTSIIFVFSILLGGGVAAIAPVSSTLLIDVEISTLIGGGVTSIAFVFSNLLGGGVAAAIAPVSSTLLGGGVVAITPVSSTLLVVARAPPLVGVGGVASPISNIPDANGPKAANPNRESVSLPIAVANEVTLPISNAFIASDIFIREFEVVLRPSEAFDKGVKAKPSPNKDNEERNIAGVASANAPAPIANAGSAVANPNKLL